LQAGDFGAAEKAYRAALRADPRSLDARLGLGVALRGAGKHRAAKKQYQRVLDEDASHGGALFNLAILKADFLDDRKGALPLLEQFIEQSPEGLPQRKLAQQYVEDIRMEFSQGGEP